MINTFIFDLDGLLIDSEIISYYIIQEILEKHHHSFTKEEYSKNYSGKTDIANINNMITTYHLPYTVLELKHQIEEIEKHYLEKGIPLKSGVKELLSFLKENHKTIVLATSSYQDRAINILRQHQILDYFDEMTFGHEVTHSKPNPDIFLLACKKVNQEPASCVVLEDSEAGIMAAYQARIPVICVPDIKQPGLEFLEKTLKTCSSLLEVLSYLEEHHM